MQYEQIQLTHCVMDTYCPTPPMDTLPVKASIVICPGGGYSHLAKREAEPIALTFAAMGFDAYVVWYRVAPDRYPSGLLDVAEAVAWVRSHAAARGADPEMIAVMGFSAGGHVAGSLGVRWMDAALMAQAGLTPEQVRPNAQVLCYPVITGGEHAHRGSFQCLTGVDDLCEHRKHSLENLVTPDTPPTFLWHTWADGSVPVENTLLMATALRRAGVLMEVHIFPNGGHGLALATELTAKVQPECAVWPEMAARFLRDVFRK